MKTYVVIAAYNEEKRLGTVIKDLRKHGYNNIVVVDDGSRDSTGQAAGKVQVIRHIINRGQGAALKTGIDYALSDGADIIVTYDADGQFLVSEIGKMVEPVARKQADITLGSRFKGTAKDIPFLKKLVLKLGIMVVLVLYGIRVTDSQCGFRAISRAAAKKISITSDRMEHAGEILHEIMRNRLKYKEVPITVIYDQYSLSKGQDWVKSIELGIKMLKKRVYR